MNRFWHLYEISFLKRRVFINSTMFHNFLKSNDCAQSGIKCQRYISKHWLLERRTSNLSKLIKRLASTRYCGIALTGLSLDIRSICILRKASENALTRVTPCSQEQTVAGNFCLAEEARIPEHTNSVKRGAKLTKIKTKRRLPKCSFYTPCNMIYMSKFYVQNIG